MGRKRFSLYLYPIPRVALVHRAFESWNDQDYNRRFHQIQILTDTPDDYEPKKQIRSNAKANLTSIDSKILPTN